jgi:hypothetical protein
MAEEPKPRYLERHARYQHVFVVGRLPKPSVGEETHPQISTDVMLTKAFSTEDEAEQEAARLNAENGDCWTYFVRVARLVPKGADAVS